MTLQQKHPIQSLFHLTPDSFLICSGLTYKSTIKQPFALEFFTKIINTLGQQSASAQGLKQVITNMVRFNNTSQRIYVKFWENRPVGFVKIGEKNLFYRQGNGSIKELMPTCVLDFYVCEQMQRNGFGKEIFEKFLESEQIGPEKLAYDRPSPKLIAFLKKHYQLTEFIPQNNNYVIFNKFFAIGETKHFNQSSKTPSLQTLTSRTARSNSQLGTQKISVSSISQQKQKQIQFNQQIDHMVSNPVSSQKRPQQKIIDSLQLQMQKKQIQRSKTRNSSTTPNPNLASFNYQNQHIKFPVQAKDSTNNYHMISKQQSHKQYMNTSMQSNNNNTSSNNGNSIENGDGNLGRRYSMNQKLKDLSFRVPFATELNGTGILTNSSNPYTNTNAGSNTFNKNIAFRTTSNAYGNHYNFKR